MREVEMEEDALHGGREGDERDDLHLTAADGTQEREHLVDAGQELRPQHAAAGQGLRIWSLEAAGLVNPDTALDVARDHAIKGQHVVVVVRMLRACGAQCLRR
jgi:hypothetical protein